MDTDKQKGASLPEDTQENVRRMLEMMCLTNRRPVIYDVGEKPEDRTMEEVLSIYKETGVLVIDGRGKSSINTRIGQ